MGDIKVNPCTHCVAGWGLYDCSEDNMKSCKDDCPYFKEYCESLVANLNVRSSKE